VHASFANGELQTTGAAIVKLLPPRDIFSPANEHGIQKARVIDKLQAFFDRFFTL
jgi:type I restriction enzyme R subunit